MVGNRTWLPAVALACLSLAAACSKSAMKVESPDTLYETAARAHADGDYELAVLRYRELLDHYPLDPRAEEVELRIAHAHLANGSYPEAIAAFSDFQRMHPTSPHLPEVEYRIAEAYVDQIDTIDRDLGAARNAHQRLQGILARYPRSEFRKEIKDQLRLVREHLAGRELYIAEYYFDRQHYPAGWVRAETVLEKFPETSTAQEAATVLAQAAREQGDDETERLAEAAAEELAKESSEGADAAPRVPGPALDALRVRLRAGPPAPAPTPPAS